MGTGSVDNCRLKNVHLFIFMVILASLPFKLQATDQEPRHPQETFSVRQSMRRSKVSSIFRSLAGLSTDSIAARHSTSSSPTPIHRRSAPIFKEENLAGLSTDVERHSTSSSPTPIFKEEKFDATDGGGTEKPTFVSSGYLEAPSSVPSNGPDDDEGTTTMLSTLIPKQSSSNDEVKNSPSNYEDSVDVPNVEQEVKSSESAAAAGNSVHRRRFFRLGKPAMSENSHGDHQSSAESKLVRVLSHGSKVNHHGSSISTQPDSTGAYEFGYDTNPGPDNEESPGRQYRRERRLPNGVVFGRFGFVDSAGKKQETHYVSDSWGYRIVRPNSNITIYPDPKNATNNKGPTTATMAVAVTAPLKDGPKTTLPTQFSSNYYPRKKNGMVILYTAEMSDPEKRKRFDDQQITQPMNSATIPIEPSLSGGSAAPSYSSSQSSGGPIALPLKAAEAEPEPEPEPTGNPAEPDQTAQPSSASGGSLKVPQSREADEPAPLSPAGEITGVPQPFDPFGSVFSDGPELFGAVTPDVSLSPSSREDTSGFDGERQLSIAASVPADSNPRLSSIRNTEFPSANRKLANNDQGEPGRRRLPATIFRITTESAISPGEAAAATTSAYSSASKIAEKQAATSGDGVYSQQGQQYSSAQIYQNRPPSPAPIADPDDLWYHGNLDPHLPERQQDNNHHLYNDRPPASSSLVEQLHAEYQQEQVAHQRYGGSNKQNYYGSGSGSGQQDQSKPGAVFSFPRPEYKPIPKPGSPDDPHIQMLILSNHVTHGQHNPLKPAYPSGSGSIGTTAGSQNFGQNKPVGGFGVPGSAPASGSGYKPPMNTGVINNQQQHHHHHQSKPQHVPYQPSFPTAVVPYPAALATHHHQNYQQFGYPSSHQTYIPWNLGGFNSLLHFQQPTIPYTPNFVTNSWGGSPANTIGFGSHQSHGGSPGPWTYWRSVDQGKPSYGAANSNQGVQSRSKAVYNTYSSGSASLPTGSGVSSPSGSASDPVNDMHWSQFLPQTRLNAGAGASYRVASFGPIFDHHQQMGTPVWNRPYTFWQPPAHTPTVFGRYYYNRMLKEDTEPTVDGSEENNRQPFSEEDQEIGQVPEHLQGRSPLKNVQATGASTGPAAKTSDKEEFPVYLGRFPDPDLKFTSKNSRVDNDWSAEDSSE